MLSQNLFEDNREMYLSCLDHPFVQGIASGDLETKKFIYFISQDAFYLNCYTRVFAAAIAKSDNYESMDEFKYLLLSSMEEMKLHRQYSQKWGFDIEKVKPGRATLEYTNFLLKVAAYEDTGRIAAAATPCYSLYSFIGKHLYEVLNPESPYAEWVQTYAGEDASAAKDRIEGILDKYGRDDETTRGYYRLALKMEYNFFDEAWKEG